MNRRWVFGAWAIVSLGGLAAAQDEQWLQYHFGREVGSGTQGSSVPVQLGSVKPEAVNWPQDRDPKSWFGKWPTPMAKGGWLWFVVYRNTRSGAYDRLCIDADGDLDLAEENPQSAYRTDTNRSQFGPVKVVFSGPDGPTTHHINVDCRFSTGGNDAYVWSGGWYEGDVTLDGAEKHCVLLDYNSNGVFGESSLDLSQADRIVFGDIASSVIRLVGRYVEIDGKLYELDVARDGAFIKIKPAQDVRYGQIRLPSEITQFIAGGPQGHFACRDPNGLARLPVGKYRIDQWVIDRKDGSGVQWSLRGYGFGGTGLFEVLEQGQPTLTLGEPILSSIRVRLQGGQYSIGQGLTGGMGESITLSHNGARSPPPKLRIRSKDGGYDRTYNFSYG